MKNDFNVPSIFVETICEKEKDHIKEENCYSITELLQPTYIIQLSKKYDIEEDVRDNVIALLGTAFHYYMENHVKIGENEVKVEAVIDGIKIKGIIDVLDTKNNLICDYKTVNVNKVLNADFDDYVKQIKLYAYLEYLKGTLITKGKIYLLMKDWKKIMLSKSATYPITPIHEHEFEITQDDMIWAENFIKNKIADIKNNKDKCNDDECWYSGDKWAVVKENNTKALKVFTDENEANDYAISKKANVEYRKGEFIRCENYCKFKEVCGGK